MTRTNLVRFVLLALLLPSIAYSKQLKIAVIDTGFDFKYYDQVKLCKKGHRDFTQTKLQDTVGHGTHVSGLIEKYSDGADYCQYILKFFSVQRKLWTRKSEDTVETTILAVKEAIRLKVDVINYSAEGGDATSKEAAVWKQALDLGIIVVAASGNKSHNLDKRCDAYPACYDKRIIVVGSKSPGNYISDFGNYGKVVDVYEVGERVESVNGVSDGTSMAAAIQSGRQIKALSKRRK